MVPVGANDDELNTFGLGTTHDRSGWFTRDNEAFVRQIADMAILYQVSQTLVSLCVEGLDKYFGWHVRLQMAHKGRDHPYIVLRHDMEDIQVGVERACEGECIGRSRG